MDRDALQEKIREMIEKNYSDIDSDQIAELAINAIWDEIEDYIRDHELEDSLFND